MQASRWLVVSWRNPQYINIVYEYNPLGENVAATTRARFNTQYTGTPGTNIHR